MAGRRPGAASKRSTAMRPPSFRPGHFRAQTATPTFGGRASPTPSIVSVATSRARSPSAGSKRKERDYEQDGSEETNINVVVRCRGRNDREIRENSGVVVSTSGIKGSHVELSMGPNALNNKMYQFDKVFSPAADQVMLFEEVVIPILDEVLSGFNCTIFAYGQTGTGKTYTMSGDITDVLPTPENAGIIPRVLHYLFGKLDTDDAENSVKCSFIELYNEELRDLLSPEDHVKLKIFEDNSRRGHAVTVVQGMEETHIKSASKGIQLLREGSHKRQVAATKCNDLSSRSHTVFTITVYMKKTSETGEDFVSASKLNLVDLAGSENIQRSGAENKRATEAGLINKSLLTLGRVINALVDRSSHIPYRESKLTRLLQDSLGGRTKTCIIATLSPAKSNLEETISTLDYAFRAKNIRNKPQVNQMISKKTLLKEFTVEIEKLKAELIATRQRNGVYLTQETYEEITTESESRRILTEEQRDKIETLEINLRNKIQELFSLTTNFNNLKKDNDATRMVLAGTKSILEKTEVVLEHTRQNLAEETILRKAHEKTEENLANVGRGLISTLDKTTSDIGGLHSKLRRRSELQSVNRRHWTATQSQVVDTTELVEERMQEFQALQEELMENLASRMQSFVSDELQKLEATQNFLKEKAEAFTQSEKEVNEQTAKSRDNMNEVLEEIKTLREDVKQKVGTGLNDLSAAAQRISAGIVTEIDAFHTQLHSSYAALGREFKSAFEELVKTLNEQQTEAEELRKQIVQANIALVSANQIAQARLSEVIEEEKQKAMEERQSLLTQVTNLITSTAEAQEKRATENLLAIGQSIEEANTEYDSAHSTYNQGMNSWSEKSQDLIGNVVRSRDSIKTKLKADFASANAHTSTLRQTTTSVHDSTIAIVEKQMAHMDTELESLDEIIARVRAQNTAHHETHTTSLSSLASTVQESYASIGEHFATSFSRIQELGDDMASKASALQDTLPRLDEKEEIRASLRELREEITCSKLQEYVSTGQTPARMTYTYPSALPRTEGHDALITKLRGGKGDTHGEERSPAKGLIFTDIPLPEEDQHDTLRTPTDNTSAGHTEHVPSLRELDVNVIATSTNSNSTEAPSISITSTTETDIKMPPLKRQHTTNSEILSKNISSESRLPMKMKKGRNTVASVAALERENLLVADFSASVGPGSGRRLRSHGPL